MTRSPILFSSIDFPTATILPQISAPCMIGKSKGFPDQLPSSLFSAEDFEYQPILVLISVLLIPAAFTLMSTSSSFGIGTSTSDLYSSFSIPPCPIKRTACISFGTRKFISRYNSLSCS